MHGLRNMRSYLINMPESHQSIKNKLFDNVIYIRVCVCGLHLKFENWVVSSNRDWKWRPSLTRELIGDLVVRYSYASRIFYLPALKYDIVWDAFNLQNNLSSSTNCTMITSAERREVLELNKTPLIKIINKCLKDEFD